MNNFDKINVGPVTRNGVGMINIDFPAGDTNGVALDIGPTPASASAKAVIRLGDHYIGQNAAGEFSVVNAAGAEIFNASLAGSSVPQKYLLAAVVPSNVHMDLDTSFSDYVPLNSSAGVTTQAQANARANAMKAVAIAHAASVGTYLVDGYHKLADTANAATLAAVPAASTLATSKTLTTALFAWLVNHGDNITDAAHFNADATAGAATVTDSTPDDLDEVALVLNEILVLMQAHFARGISAS